MTASAILWLKNIPERLKTLDAAGLKLFQITMTVDITPGKQAYDPKFKEVMPLLKGRGVQFLLLMNGHEALRPRRRCAGRGDRPRDGGPGAGRRRPSAAVSAQQHVDGARSRTASAWRTRWTARTWA